MTTPRIRIATRKSPLALAQTRHVAERLRAHHPGLEVDEVHLVTEGDRVLDRPLAKVGGKGLFVSEVEAALDDGRADLAVHSMKDVPEALMEGMAILCVPEREDPRDVLVTADGAGLFDLRAGARVGTSSLRRAVQIRRLRRDLALGVVRGNVGTRLRKLDEGEHDAIVLAYAGLRRLGLDAERKLAILPPEQSIPAVGQGALALEGRANDTTLRALLAPLEHEATRIAVEAERAFLVRLHGSCSTPLAAHARIEDGRLFMDAIVASLDAEHAIVHATSEVLPGGGAEARVRAAHTLGERVADEVLARGGAEMIEAAKSAADPYAALYAR